MTLHNEQRWSYSWLLGLIVGMTAVMALTGFIGLKLLEDRLVKIEGENLALVAVDIAEKFNLLFIGLHGDIQLLGDTASRVTWDRKRWTAHLNSVKTAYPYYHSLGLTDPTGRIVATTDEATMGMDVSGDKWFTDVSSDTAGVQVWDVSPDELAQGVDTVSFAVPLTTDPSAGQKGFQGAVVGRIGMPMLEEIVTRTIRARRAEQNFTENLEYQVMNQRGQLFIDSDLFHKGNVNLKTIGLTSAHLVQSGKSGYVEEEHLRRHVPVITGYAQLAGYGHYKEQSELRWGVLVRVDRAEVLAPVRSVLWKIGLWGGVLFLPMLAALLWMVRRLEQARQREQCTQASLQESHAFLQSTLDALTSHIAILDERGTIVAVNDRWRQFAVDTQLPDPRRTIGMNYLQVCDTAVGPCSEEAKEVAKGIRALIQGLRNQCKFEYPCHGPDRQRWFAVRISRFDLDGIPRLVVVHEDITVNKLAVQAILQLSETARLVISNALDAHIMIDEHGIIVGWNAQAEQMFGWPEGKAMGRRLSETIVPPNYQDAYERDWRHFLTSGTGPTLNKRIELVGRHREGRQLPIEVSVILVEKQEGYTISAFVRDLTERKRAESDQTRLLTVLNASLNEIYMFSTDTLRFIYVNRSALDNLGYTLEAMQALTPIDIKPEMTEASFRELVNPLLTGKRAQLIFQTVHQRKNGSIYSVEVHLQVVGQGEEQTFLAFIHDVTERKQQEHRQAVQYVITRLLLESNTLEEAAPYIMGMICQTLGWNVGVMWRVDEDMQVLRCAEVWDEKADCTQFIECTRLSNFAVGIGLPGRVWKSRRVEWITDVVCDDNFPRAPSAVDAGLHAALAFPIGSRDRFYGVMEFYATALREPDQKLLDMFEGLAGQISQFLERKLAEQRLHNAKAQAEKAAREKAQILATVEAFFIGVTDQGTVSEWTNRAEQLLEISMRDAIGRSLRDLPIAWSWDEILAALGKTCDTLTTVRLEKVRLTVPGAKEKFVKLTISPLCEDRGVGYVIMGEDVTDRLVLEDELVQAQKLESIGHLAAGIAHEINTPTQFVGDNVRFLSDSFSDIGRLLEQYQCLLAAIKTGGCPEALIESCEAANRKADLEYLLAEIPKAIEQSAEGIDRVATIVRAMKEFAHPGSREKAAVNLNKAIESTVTVARNEWKYVADLHTNLDPSLPPVPCLVGEFNQVVLNIIVNATHAIADAVKGTGGKGTITICTSRVGDFVEVRIADTGMGIPESIRHKIFDPFFTTKEVGKGTGQGLAIARSVVVGRHGGTIAVDSKVGKGTTFLIRLPLNALPANSLKGGAP
jgi:PAS domain S-box-containing protein